MFVRIDSPGLMSFCSPYNNTILPHFHDMHIHIRIFLSGGRQTTVTFRIGHRSVNRKVVFLYKLHIFSEPLVIFCPKLLVHLIGGRENGIESIHSHTTLETGCRLLSHQTLHFHFIHQIFRALVEMAKTVDPLADQR